ncbi:hypothetical protein QVD17_09314 [Tagetes erecta]|uniref:F-box associated beta-propeller type 1 domain-containing protein n=1 Tax=Tagetes erecta TaxID=13708 RepID=A0AAD8L0Q6_TARER|nr:hypothetical protein QVD17_09314 [Tagetes erecta]
MKLTRFLKRSSIIGSSHGLLCLYGDYQYSHDGLISGKARVVLWNLLLGKVVAVVVRNVAFTRHYSANAESYMNEEMYGSVLGFGVCRETTDPKVVKINYINTNWPREMKSTIPWQVEVFTLSTGAWRRPRCVNLPRRSISFVQFGVGVDVGGVIYWLARNRIIFNGRFRYSYHLIVSFDLTTEEFREINLPDSLARSGGYNLSICKHRESLIVLERHNEAVWMLKDGVPEPLTKVFTIGNTPHISIVYVYVRGFRKTGEPIIEIEEDHSQRSGERPLGVYERNSKHVNNIGIIGMCNSFSVYSFVGTLLLLDQPNVKIYDKRLVRL